MLSRCVIAVLTSTMSVSAADPESPLLADTLAPLRGMGQSLPDSQPTIAAPEAEPAAQKAEETGKFTSPVDGMFDASAFLSSRTGFMPVAMPITEPAVGYGLALGLTFFHGEPKQIESGASGIGRVIMPSTTVVIGAATDNGTWATGVAHLGVWNEGKTRYVGAVGYASANLDWYGKGDSFGGQSFAYTNDVFFVAQNIKFQLEGTDVFVGPMYRFIGSDSSFTNGGMGTGIPQFELESQTSGVGVEVSYDTLDHPFAPTRGVRANITYTEQGEWLGGDFDYAKVQTFAIGYIPLADNLVVGMKLNADYVGDGAPFYDLSSIDVRGLDRGRYTDSVAVYGETEVRWDIDRRWSLIGFGSGGTIAESFNKLSFGDSHWAAGGGFRYLIAERYGLRLGVDLAYGDDSFTVYVGVGTGWIRP